MAAACQSPIYPSLAWRTLLRRGPPRATRGSPRSRCTGSLTATLSDAGTGRTVARRRAHGDHNGDDTRNDDTSEILDAGKRARRVGRTLAARWPDGIRTAKKLTSLGTVTHSLLDTQKRKYGGTLATHMRTHIHHVARASRRARARGLVRVHAALHRASRRGAERSGAERNGAATVVPRTHTRARAEAHGTFWKRRRNAASLALYIYVSSPPSVSPCHSHTRSPAGSSHERSRGRICDDRARPTVRGASRKRGPPERIAALEPSGASAIIGELRCLFGGASADQSRLAARSSPVLAFVSLLAAAPCRIYRTARHDFKGAFTPVTDESLNNNSGANA